MQREWAKSRLELVEEPFDQVSLSIDPCAERETGFSIALWRDVGPGAALIGETAVFDIAETIAYLIDPVLERIERLAVDGTWEAKSCDRILGEGRSAGGLKYVVMEKSDYLIIFDKFDDRIEAIDIVYGSRDLPGYLGERIYALDRTSPTKASLQSRPRQSRGRHTKTDDQNDH